MPGPGVVDYSSRTSKPIQHGSGPNVHPTGRERVDLEAERKKREEIAARHKQQQEIKQFLGPETALGNPLLNVDPSKVQNPQTLQARREAIAAAEAERQEYFRQIDESKYAPSSDRPTMGMGAEGREKLAGVLGPRHGAFFEGVSPELAARQARARSQAQMTYGSREPSYGAMLSQHMRQNDAIRGIPGMTESAHTVMQAPIGAGIGSALMRSTPLLRSVAAGMNRAGEVTRGAPVVGPVINVAHKGAKVINPDAARLASSPVAKVGLKMGANPLVSQGINYTLDPSQSQKDQSKIISTASKFTPIPGYVKYLPLLTGNAAY